MHEESEAATPQSEWWLGTTGSDGAVGGAYINARVPLSTERHEEIMAASRSLHGAMERPSAMILTRNYAELQRVIVGLGDLPSLKGIDMRAVQLEVTSALLNWLMAFRMFTDHTAKEISTRFGSDSPELAELKRSMSEAYDDHVGYRVLFRLRNAAQHRTTPPLTITVGEQLEPSAPGGRAAHASIGLERDLLLAKYDRWSSVADELKKMPERIGLLPLVTDAMNGVNKPLSVLLDLDFPDLRDSVSVLEKALGDLKDERGQPIVVKLTPEDGPPSTMTFQFVPFHLVRAARSILGAA